MMAGVGRCTRCGEWPGLLQPGPDRLLQLVENRKTRFDLGDDLVLFGTGVMLIEADGTQYRAEPAPQPSGQWQTFDVPFDRFARGGWSTDENDRLDLNDVRYVVIGVHGTADEAKASGTIWIADVEFLP